jgi:hypothetical protein
MTNSVHSIQAVHAQSQTEQAVQPPKTLPAQETAKQNTASQDTVTISQQARQALTHSTTQAGGGGANGHGDNH